MTDTFTPQEELQRKIRTRKLLTWLIVFAIVMFFAGLTSAYVVSMSAGYWVEFKLPEAFHYSTVAIVLSSASMQLAVMMARRGRSTAVPGLLAVTLLLGLFFTWSQFQGWKALVERGNFVVGRVLDNKGTYGEDWLIRRDHEALVLENGNFYAPSDGATAQPLNAELEEQRNSSSSYFYVLTAAHLAHLLFGLLSLLVMLVMAIQGRYSREDHAGLWAGAVYWHFLGGLWVYLLLFLTIVH